ncbi:hypothetical protein EBR96_09970, partial [bacterium]|nr:hypothetical protein [bacterium]
YNEFIVVALPPYTENTNRLNIKYFTDGELAVIGDVGYGINRGIIENKMNLYPNSYTFNSHVRKPPSYIDIS